MSADGSEYQSFVSESERVLLVEALHLYRKSLIDGADLLGRADAGSFDPPQPQLATEMMQLREIAERRARAASSLAVKFGGSPA